MRYGWPAFLTGVVVAAGAFTAHADIDEIQLMARRSDGLFEVECRNGTREIVTVNQVRQADVCGGGGGRNQIVCTGNGGFVYPTRVSDGRRLGSYMSAEQCEAVSEAAHDELVCTTTGAGAWWVTRIGDGSRLGTNTEFISCLKASRFMHGQISCIPAAGDRWRPARIHDLGYFGSLVERDTCFEAVLASNEGVVCASQGGLAWSVYRIVDGAKLDANSDLEECAYATYRAAGGRVCLNSGGNDRWQVTEIATGYRVGNPVALAACVTQL